MEWLKTMAIGKEIVCNFNIKSYCFISIFLLCLNVLGQSKNNSKNSFHSRFQINTYGIFLFVVDPDPYDYGEDYEVIDLKSYISGFNFELNYWVDDELTLGLGSGIETLDQPKIKYVPIYAGLRWYPSIKEREGWAYRVALGTHLGEVSKTGTLFRFGMDYSFPVLKSVKMELGFLVSFQGLRKRFVDNETYYYDLRAGGLTLGLIF